MNIDNYIPLGADIISMYSRKNIPNSCMFQDMKSRQRIVAIFRFYFRDIVRNVSEIELKQCNYPLS